MATDGDEKPASKADTNSENKSEKGLNACFSGELVSLWRAGVQEAARILVARYELRLMALVVHRLNRKYRSAIAPEEVVQSAFGSFFRVARGGGKVSIELRETESAWKILATFVRRKLSRAVEREQTLKRGGNKERISLDEANVRLSKPPTNSEADELLSDIDGLLADDEKVLWESLLIGLTQKEIASRLNVDERTIRRRIAALRARLESQRHMVENRVGTVSWPPEDTRLPNIGYRDFVLGKLIGRGSLGKVYRARLQSSGALIAVKFMHRQFWEQRPGLKSFIQEIEQAAKIEYPGVIKYLGWGQSPHGGPYIVMNFVEGVALSRMELRDADGKLDLFRQICEAISACHEAGVVHGDLTPNNVLVSIDGRVVVSDFGFAISKKPNVQSEANDEAQFSYGGTLGYAAPEQVASAFGKPGPATDVFAIGGIAYYLLTGKPPIDSDNILLETISEVECTVTFEPKSDAEKKLLDVSNAALKKLIGSRPPSVQALLKLLE